MINVPREWPCRDCAHMVKIFDDVCPICGAYAPLRIPCTPVMRVAAMCIAAIFVIRLTSVLSL